MIASKKCTELGLRNDALSIFHHSVRYMSGENCVRRNLHVSGNTIVMGDYTHNAGKGKVRVVGLGKAAASMGRAVENILGDIFSEGFLVVKEGYDGPSARSVLMTAGHPIPDSSSMEAASKIMDICRRGGGEDTLIALVSGGGSSCAALPAGSISLADKIKTFSCLQQAGADIGSVNTIRRHISGIKGGRLAGMTAAGALLCLVISDVPSDMIEDIASGPFHPDKTTFQDCLSIIERFRLKNDIPETVINHIMAGISGDVPETLKNDNKSFEKVRTILAGNCVMLCDEAARKAAGMGYSVARVNDCVTGDTEEAARYFADITRQIMAESPGLPVCVVSGGETTVKGPYEGCGGRAAHFALAIASDLAGLDGQWCCVSAGTDGSDGPNRSAGAVSDNTTAARAEKKGMRPENFLARRDSHSFFGSLGDLIHTGYTGTNLMDLRIILIGRPQEVIL